jgi:hypothetical protein
MAEEQQPRDDAPDRGGDAGGGRPGEQGGPRPPSDEKPGVDQTREFDPFAEQDGTTPDETAAMPSGGRRPAGDETVAFPAGDETAALPPGGPPPAGDETAVIPPAPSGWSGRAEVRPPGAGGGLREAAPAGWDERDLQDGRRWWMPIVVGLVALLLLGVLGYGIWLAAQNNEEREPVAPVTTASAVTTTAPATTAPATTPAGPTTPATSAVASEVVPPLTGLDVPTARDILRDVGLEARTENRESDAVPPGRVIESRPPVGTTVPRGTEIVLIVATAPPPAAPPTTEPAVTESPTTGTTG